MRVHAFIRSEYSTSGTCLFFARSIGISPTRQHLAISTRIMGIFEGTKLRSSDCKNLKVWVDDKQWWNDVVRSHQRIGQEPRGLAVTPEYNCVSEVLASSIGDPGCERTVDLNINVVAVTWTAEVTSTRNSRGSESTSSEQCESYQGMERY